jgi:radical SAM protein
MKKQLEQIDFGRTPFSVIWEVTRACDLRCRHCRADANTSRHPLELTTAEGFDLIGQVRDLGPPVFVFTGGDPLKRPDLFDLITHARSLGLPVAVTPSGTPLLTREAIYRMREAGVQRIALSLDGPRPAIHDHFRQEPESFQWTVSGIRHARECDLPVQVNTTVTRHNIALLGAMAQLVGDLGAAMWSVFFLVTVGRARIADQLAPHEFEEVFGFLYEVSRRSPFAVRTTAAPHYRRLVLQQRAMEKRAGGRPDPPRVAGMVGPRAQRGVTDGNGLVFISHTGEVFPSGFLPLGAGNVRRTHLAEIYRDAPLFRTLRDTAKLEGKCGVCEFRRVCGGSRARAYATTGNFMAEEPYCTYEPRRAAGRQAAPMVGG